MNNPIDKELTYKVSRWQRFLYEEEKFNNQSLQDNELSGLKINQDYGCFQKETFARLYTNNQLNKIEAPDEWSEKLHQQLDDSREFQSLANRCKGDEFWSGLACSTVSKQLVAELNTEDSKDHDNTKQEVIETQNLIDGLLELQKKGADVKGRLAKAKAKLKRSEKQLNEVAGSINFQAMQTAIRKACEQANSELNETEQLIDSLTYTDSKGSIKSGTNAKQKREIADKLSYNHKLKEIAKLAGRLRRIATEKQRSKAEDSCNEIKNIQQGDSIDRLLPSELISLVDPDYEALFYSKFLERQLLQYELAGKEKEGKGPMIVCIDESGSMRGDRDVWAKAVSLALLEIARKQKRSWALVHFASTVEKVHTVEKQASDINIIEAIDYFQGGGTNFEEPLKTSLDLIESEKLKKADVILVTDGVCDVSDEFLADWTNTKTNLEFSLYSIAIHCRNTVTLDKISDKVFRIEDIYGGSNNEIEDSLFSI